MSLNAMDCDWILGAVGKELGKVNMPTVSGVGVPQSDRYLGERV
jgi:hypothetical protein